MKILNNSLAAVIRIITGVSTLPREQIPNHSSLYFSNHTSHLDFLIIWSILPHEIREKTSPVAAADYWQATRLKRWVSKKIFNAVYIQRKGRSSNNIHPLDNVVNALGNGRNIILFPEGSRSSDGKMKKFKPGLYHLAKMFPDTLLVPLYLENLNRILPKGERLPIPLIGKVYLRKTLQRIPEENKETFLIRAQQAVTLNET